MSSDDGQLVGLTLGVLVELAEVVSLLLVDDSKNSGDRLSDRVDLGELGGGSSGNLLDSKGEELLLELNQLLGEVGLVLGDELVSSDFAGGGGHGD